MYETSTILYNYQNISNANKTVIKLYLLDPVKE